MSSKLVGGATSGAAGAMAAIGAAADGAAIGGDGRLRGSHVERPDLESICGAPHLAGAGTTLFRLRRAPVDISDFLVRRTQIESQGVDLAFELGCQSLVHQAVALKA